MTVHAQIHWVPNKGILLHDTPFPVLPRIGERIFLHKPTRRSYEVVDIVYENIEGFRRVDDPHYQIFIYVK